MNFSNPFYFTWLIPWTIVSLVLLGALRSRRDLIGKIWDLETVKKVFPLDEWKSRGVKKIFLWTAGVFFLILALAGPEIGQKLETVTVKAGNVFILFDCSDSMQAEDFKPTRTDKAKRLLTALLEKLHGHRVGIIAFAGEAYVYCPMTFDLSTARQFLKSIEPGMIPQPGTKIGSAIRLALSRMGEGKGSGSVVLLTDGEDHKSDPEGAAEEAKESGVRIFAIGVGSPEGEPIPIRDSGGSVTGYKKKKNGEVVLSRLDEAALAKIATRTGGSYYRATEAEQEIDLLADQLNHADKNSLTQKKNVYQNRYQWFLLLGLAILLAGESLEFFPRIHKRSAGIAVLLLLFLLSDGRAAGFSGKMREGDKLYKKEKYADASEAYGEAQTLKPADRRANFNRGAALYKNQDWDQAKEEFQKSATGGDSRLNAKSLYNLGNSFFQQGNYKEAAEAYKQGLKLDPQDDDAKHNLRLSLQFIQNPPPQKDNGKPDEESKSEQQKARQAEEDEQKKEKEENAKRILKGAAGDENNKPLFKPGEKDKKDREYEEDW